MHWSNLSRPRFDQVLRFWPTSILVIHYECILVIHYECILVIHYECILVIHCECFSDYSTRKLGYDNIFDCMEAFLLMRKVCNFLNFPKRRIHRKVNYSDNTLWILVNSVYLGSFYRHLYSYLCAPILLSSITTLIKLVNVTNLGLSESGLV